ncbi:FAD-binding protein [Mycena indigotica]|uniref:FAD-binding protein n=1 Tax=Mycena indigotica TaxID=2126181 RepID=A0A8H6T4Q2_9AGAR|nr:FAD-binding protein [Mycena indigotica]KAF7312050.1 FAD-binding protein [Mycena indigotica]
MKVVIVGGGVGGISMYLALRKHLAAASPPIDITLFESHENISTMVSAVNAGLCISPNGLRAISRISVDAAGYIQQRGFSSELVTFKDLRGYGMGQTMIARDDVHDAFVRELRPGDMTLRKKVKYVKENGDQVEVALEDGTMEYADIVIGADGVQSVVREAIYGQRYAAQHQGYISVGGLISISSLSDSFRKSLRTEAVTITSGGNSFLGYSPCSPNIADLTSARLMWWSTYQAKESPLQTISASTILAQLKNLSTSSKSPADSPTSNENLIRELLTLSIGDSSKSGLFVLPEYLTPPLPHWTSLSGSGRILLLGDAAHAMSSYASQGVACAVEDALTIAVLLKHYYVSHRSSVTNTLRKTGIAVGIVCFTSKGTSKLVAESTAKLLSADFMSVLCISSTLLAIFPFNKLHLGQLPKSSNHTQFDYDVESEIAKYISKSGCDKEL